MYPLCSIDSVTPPPCPWYDDCGVCQGDNSTCNGGPGGGVNNPGNLNQTDRTDLQIIALRYEDLTPS
jgi:hypothetical protein